MRTVALIMLVLAVVAGIYWFMAQQRAARLQSEKAAMQAESEVYEGQGWWGKYGAPTMKTFLPGG